MLEHVVAACSKNARKSSSARARHLAPRAGRKPFHRLHYDDAVKLLATKDIAFEWGGDFGAPMGRRSPSRSIGRCSSITSRPRSRRSTWSATPVAWHSLSVDYLAPEGTAITGGQRSADLAYLEGQIEAHGLPKKAFEWYLDLRRYGSVPHAGFGIGVERTLAWICGLEHVRESIAFPRLLNRLEP